MGSKIVKRACKRWNREKALEQIKQLSARGERLYLRNVVREHPGLAYAGGRYFGSWAKAIEAAGLDYGKIRRKSFWTRAGIVEQILTLDKSGKPLNLRAVEQSDSRLIGAANSYFGSWRKAIEAAGFDYATVKRRKEWSKREVVTEIKRMKREGVNTGTTMEVRAKYNILHAAAVRYFGTWRAALKAAGLEKLYGQSGHRP